MEKYMTEQHVKIASDKVATRWGNYPYSMSHNAVAKADLWKVNNSAKFRISLAFIFA